MFNTKKLYIIISAAMLTILTSCNFSSYKNEKTRAVFDFSSIISGANNSRSAMSDLLEANENLYADLKLEGGFTYNQTINLKESQIIQIDNIPVGSRIKALVELYTITKNQDDDQEVKSILYKGQSKTYTIIEGENKITIPLKKYKAEQDADPAEEQNPGEDPNDPNDPNGGGGGSQQEDEAITIWVSYDADHQGNYWNEAENKSNEDPTNDGTTEDTGFYYIQSAINWIAQNGDGNKDYEIMLSGYDETHAFEQDVYETPAHTYQATVIFGETEATADNLNGHAKSITLTSEKPGITAIKANNGIDNLLIRTTVPLIFKNIKITTDNRCRILAIEYGISANVFLKSGTVFSDSSTSETRGSSAIWMEGGTVTMQDNAIIENFYGSDGGAVYMKYGSFCMEDNSRIQNCKASSQGGAIYMYNASDHSPLCTLSGGTIYKCSSPEGGAIYQYGGSITIEEGTIIECKGDNYGGAIKMDGSNKNISLYLKGGSIINNESSMGSAIYLTDGNGHTPKLILSNLACVDLSNDIYTTGPKIYLSNDLTSSNEKAALLTLSSIPNWTNVITAAEGASADVIQNNYSKFFVQKTNSNDDFYIDQNGQLQAFNTTNYLENSDAVTIGDIVFADNKRVRAEQLPYLSKRLRDSIAGIVFYAGGTDDLIGERNLIVGTKTYNDKMSTSNHGASGFTMFDRNSSVEDFPGSSSRIGSYGEIRDTTSSVEITQANISCAKTTGNEKLNEGIDWTDAQIQSYNNKVTFTAVKDIMEKINNNQTSSYPLYQKIFEHGKNFDDSSKYKLNTADSDITDNWYIPTIAELKLFYDALNDSTFSNIYTTLCGNFSDYNYFSGSAIIGQGAQYPDMYRYTSGNSTYYYAYYYTIDFTAGLIKCDPSNQSLYSIPVHVYEPQE